MNMFEHPKDKEVSGKATILLIKIIEDLDPENFTLDQIKEEFNFLSNRGHQGGAGLLRQFKNRYLDSLIKAGLVKESGEPGHYFVTDTGRIFYERKDEENDEEEDE